MANPRQVVGKAKIRIDGALQVTTPGNTTLDPGGVKREAKDGDFETGGFSAVSESSKLTFKVLSDARFSPAAFGRLDNATVNIEFDNGQAWVIRHAYAEKTPSVGTDGMIECVMMGPAAEPIS